MKGFSIHSTITAARHLRLSPEYKEVRVLDLESVLIKKLSVWLKSYFLIKQANIEKALSFN